MAELIARANSKKHIVLRNRKRSHILFAGRPILLRIGSELPVIGSRLAPDNLIMNHAACCGRRIPLECRVVIQVGRDHPHVLGHTRRRRQRRQCGNVQASDLRNIAKVIELQQVAVFNAVLHPHVLVLMIVVLPPLSKTNCGKPFSAKGTMISPAQKAVESKFHHCSKSLGMRCGATWPSSRSRRKICAVNRRELLEPAGAKECRYPYQV